MASHALLEQATGRSRRWLLYVAAMALATSTALLTWWTTTLSGLPDIGDPFDVSAFADVTVPDADNAYVLYKQAAAGLSPEPSAMNYDWAAAGPVEKGWLDRNRQALELWRSGTERPGSLYISPRSMTVMTQLVVVQEIRTFVRLAALEGGRLEAEGDVEGAWGWYRAMFRTSRHVGHRGLVIQRLVGIATHDVACRHLTRWSKDPRVTPLMLRRALDAAIADDAVTRPFSDNLKVEYLSLLKSYEDPQLIQECLSVDAANSGFQPTWFARESHVFHLMKSFKKEPERSKRVSRLVFANLLGTCDLPPDRRPPPACSLANPQAASRVPTLIDLYPWSDSAPPPVRALPPDQILRWFNTTLYAQHLMPAFSNTPKSIARERITQANLLIALASRLYELDRGKPPETTEELVGPYLKALPEGYKPPESTPPMRTSP